MSSVRIWIQKDGSVDITVPGNSKRRPFAKFLGQPFAYLETEDEWNTRCLEDAKIKNGFEGLQYLDVDREVLQYLSEPEYNEYRMAWEFSGDPERPIILNTAKKIKIDEDVQKEKDREEAWEELIAEKIKQKKGEV